MISTITVFFALTDKRGFLSIITLPWDSLACGASNKEKDIKKKSEKWQATEVKEYESKTNYEGMCFAHTSRFQI